MQDMTNAWKTQSFFFDRRLEAMSNLFHILFPKENSNTNIRFPHCHVTWAGWWDADLNPLLHSRNRWCHQFSLVWFCYSMLLWSHDFFRIFGFFMLHFFLNCILVNIHGVMSLFVWLCYSYTLVITQLLLDFYEFLRVFYATPHSEIVFCNYLVFGFGWSCCFCSDQMTWCSGHFSLY